MHVATGSRYISHSLSGFLLCTHTEVVNSFIVRDCVLIKQMEERDMKFIMLTVADATIHHFDDDRKDFVIPRHNIIIPIENIIEVTSLAEQDSYRGITEIVIKNGNATSEYIVEESINDIYRTLDDGGMI